jgi:hypothetical protein
MNTQRGNMLALKLVSLGVAALVCIVLWRVLSNLEISNTELELDALFGGGIMSTMAFIRVVWLEIPGVEG